MIYLHSEQSIAFHLIAWASHKSRIPVKSTPAAETLAASEALDGLIPLQTAVELIPGTKVNA